MHTDKISGYTIQDSVLSLTISQKIQRFALRVLCRVLPYAGVNVALYHFTKVRKRSVYAASNLPGLVSTKKIPYRKGHLVTYSWGNSKKIVYLVHGWESNTGRMISFISPLVDRGFKVVAFDMPSHGHSTQQATHLRDFSLALKTVITTYGQPFGILAHSFGGTATVIMISEKKELAPKKLCLISPMKSLESHLNVFNTIAGLSEPIMKKLLCKLRNHYGLNSEETDITQLIQEVSIPGLLIHDEDDGLISIETAKSLANSWQGVRFVKSKNLGHRKILQDPKIVQEVTSYLAQDIIA